MVSFRDILFKQQAYWVSELIVDTLVPSVYLQLISNPDTSELECDVIFNNVSNVSSLFIGEANESKEEYLCTLWDVTDKIKDGKHLYVIATDTVEVSFFCEDSPEIKWVNPDKPYQTWTQEKIKLKKDA
ncbi:MULTISPECIES: hypothetical protein [unclassified Colwellia]|uniref:hypothetical protein n=1 Tax=unclassified Colwellia TaxID=196834 RepID=UPI0015F38623|nr:MULTISPECIES: hypothetical protein [unclassified Colwellia]MBA6381346.1 hypothetical protein [Colwellia sp. BRX10-7]MBA6389094.1 hypothetical protein [Colwellia sp. BRX10-2]MBA6403818.1 hypothetical protein [Colwellia sp. BRX10-5]MBA6407695.1 hypothetical protein [Colwellia sp. BRX10-1]